MNRDRKGIDAAIRFFAADLHVTAPLPGYPETGLLEALYEDSQGRLLVKLGHTAGSSISK